VFSKEESNCFPKRFVFLGKIFFMSDFHTLKVKDIKRETSDCVSVAFDVPESLIEDFKYKPGQYLTLRKILNDVDVRRSYSLCSAPHEKEWRVAVKKIEGGTFSTFANTDLKIGDEIEIMPPNGRFLVDTEKQKGQNFALFAAGSGITPMFSIAKELLAKDEDAQVTLIYGNKGFESIIFRDEIEALKNLHVDRFTVHHVLSRETLGPALNKGRISKDKCAEFFSKLLRLEDFDQFYVCGPEEMIHAVSDFLKEREVDEANIHFELFTSPVGKLGQAREEIKVEEDFDSTVTVILDTVEYNFPLNANGDTILDAAHKVGADLPFACKGGVCCTCRAKVTEGEVEMDVNYSLEKDELEQGFVLTCQAHPRTENVVVNFDIR
jgi:ring-1,2-phenylacetyl-CoA epoxidase subunit PaaE